MGVEGGKTDGAPEVSTLPLDHGSPVVIEVLLRQAEIHNVHVQLLFV
jgi:hypothetical protein